MSGPTLLDLLPEYRAYLEDERQLAPSTVHAYSSDIRGLAAFLPSDVPVAEIDRTDLRMYLRRLKIHGYSASTIRRIFHGFGTLFAWLYVEKYAPEIATQHLVLPRKNRALPRWLSADEFQRFIDACEQSPAPLGERALWLFLARTGCRPGECRALRVKDVNRADWIVTLRNTKSRRDRALSIEDGLLRAMLNVLASEKQADDLLFVNAWGRRWRRDVFSNAFTRQLKAAGLTPDLTPKTIRHTVATQLAMAGVPIHVVKEILGHLDIQTTDVYMHAAPANLRDALGKLVAEKQG